MSEEKKAGAVDVEASKKARELQELRKEYFPLYMGAEVIFTMPDGFQRRGQLISIDVLQEHIGFDQGGDFLIAPVSLEANLKLVLHRAQDMSLPKMRQLLELNNRMIAEKQAGDMEVKMGHTVKFYLDEKIDVFGLVEKGIAIYE